MLDQAQRRCAPLGDSKDVGAVGDSGAHRTMWRNHTPTEMPLPGLPDIGTAPSVSFLTVTAAQSNSLPPSRRIAVLSRTGVNLLMQRWIYHNSRVIVPTITIDEAVAAQHEEADLTMECVDGRVSKDYSPADAVELVDGWLDTKRPGGATLRHQLTNPRPGPRSARTCGNSWRKPLLPESARTEFSSDRGTVAQADPTRGLDTFDVAPPYVGAILTE